MYHRDMDEAIGLLEEGLGYKAIARRLGISPGTAKHWEYAYRACGKEALLTSKARKYPTELKLRAVHLVLDEGAPKPLVMEELGIKSKNTLNDWVRVFRERGEEGLGQRPLGRRPKPERPACATREEELEARVCELELELEIQKRINALIEEFER